MISERQNGLPARENARGCSCGPGVDIAGKGVTFGRDRLAGGELADMDDSEAFGGEADEDSRPAR